MKRLQKHQLKDNSSWDIIVIGGGATGLGTAVDAASRGLKTLLLEQSDFAKGTSSRSTKLIHGGVRYLAQGNISLVLQALRERGLLHKNAAHLVKKEEFIIPCYNWFSVIKYLTGLKLYDWLAGRYSFGTSKYLSKQKVLSTMPGIKDTGLKGGIRYFDGKFDDARLAVNLAQTCKENGGTLINYMKVVDLLKNEKGKIVGVQTEDLLTGEQFSLNAKVVINATGVFVDDILQMNNPKSKKLVKPSQGVHIVLDNTFLRSNAALMIPKTPDGRVLFAIPWYNHLLIGTTDTPLNENSLEPRALWQEIEFILNTAGNYFAKTPSERDILSVFSGLRPLAAPANENNNSTKEISRSHKLMVSAPGLLTITGGKWTTYRHMAEETVDLAIKHANLTAGECITKALKIAGCMVLENNDYLDLYGSHKKDLKLLIKMNPELAAKIHPGFPYLKAEIVWAARHEMVETLEDVLARRLRILFIDARAAIEMSATVAHILAIELQAGENWKNEQLSAFRELANNYLHKTPH